MNLFRLIQSLPPRRGLARALLLGALAGVPALAGVTGARAETYPDRPITLIIQFGAGTTTDIVGRRFGELLGAELNTPVVPVNRPGAGGTIGVGEMARAAPDGYTIGLVNMPAVAIIPHLQKVTFDPLKDLHHIAVLGPYEYGLYVDANAPWKTWEEFVAYAKANPDKVSYGTPGNGTTNHLFMARLGEDLGVKWTHVPFKGDGEVIPNVLGGHISAGVGSPGSVVPQVKSGKLRLLLVTSKDPWPALPDVPTITSKGVKYFQASFLSLAAPAGTPDAIKAKLDAAAKKILTDPAVIAEFRSKYSTDLAYQEGAAYGPFLAEQYQFYGPFLKTMKLN